jgi:hypothetical protein
MSLAESYAAYRELLNRPLPGSRICGRCGHTVNPPPSPDGPTEAELRAMPDLELVNLHRRLVLGRPPVTEEWFAELSGWFHAHEDQVRRLATNGNFISVGGRWTTADWIRDRLAEGIGAIGVGELLDEVEELKRMVGAGGQG